MSHDIKKPTDITIPSTSLFAKLPLLGGVLAVVGLGSVLGAAMGASRDRAMFAYLWAFVIFLGLALAALGWLVVDHTVRSQWSVVVKRIVETMAVTLPVFALLFLPIVTIGYHSLFPWTHETDPILLKKHWFLNDGFFFFRAALYFALWSLMAVVLYRTSVKRDAVGEGPERDRLTKLMWVIGAPGIPIYALTQSFAAIDWLMSLQPHWYSTIFGVYFFAASIQALYAFLAIITASLQKAGVLKEAVTTEHFHDLGKYTFGFTIFWAYIAFSQFILIWYANIPEETEFYITRLQGGWSFVSYALPIAHFFLPFLFLLSRNVKRRKLGLAVGCAWTLFMYAVDLYWLILPNFGIHTEAHHEAVFALSWTDFSALIGMGGAFFAVFGFFLARNKVICINDPRLPESLAHENY